jgi:hypothetical protein
MARSWFGGAVAVGVLASGLAGAPGVARADPVPGFDLDPVKLTARMDECLAFTSPKDAVLMAWINLRTGEQRTWRCTSLRHMLRVDGSDGVPHDPFVNVADFMRCVDHVVSFGFPRPSKDPGKIDLIRQYRGTSSRAIVAVNEFTGDIATIYTQPEIDDWTSCATAL